MTSEMVCLKYYVIFLFKLSFLYAKMDEGRNIMNILM